MLKLTTTVLSFTGYLFSWHLFTEARRLIICIILIWRSTLMKLKPCHVLCILISMFNLKLLAISAALSSPSYLYNAVTHIASFCMTLMHSVAPSSAPINFSFTKSFHISWQLASVLNKTLIDQLKLFIYKMGMPFDWTSKILHLLASLEVKMTNFGFLTS